MNEQGLIKSWIEILKRQKALAERAIAQLPDDALHEQVDPSVNTIATIVKHMAGNQRSRWTDWLTTDGEKPDRDRDDEFVDSLTTRDEIMARWEEGWACVFRALADLTPADLGRTVTIRAEPHSIPDAVNRQIDHYGYHVGQIVTFAKILATRHGVDWQHLSVAPGASTRFNEAMRKRHGSF
jgi:hypothetical protein